MTTANSPARKRAFIIVCLLLFGVLAALFARVFFTEIEVTSAWEVRVESVPNLAPVEVYLSGERVGMTPVTVPFRKDDPRFIVVEDLANVRSENDMFEVFGLNRDSIKPVIDMAPAPPGFDGIAGHVNLGTDESGARLSAAWWNSLRRGSDGAWDRWVPVIVEEIVPGRGHGFSLRARRGEESALAVKLEPVLRHPNFVERLSRLLFRRAHLEGTLVVTFGVPLDFDQSSRHPDQPEERVQKALEEWFPHPGSTWLLDRYPPGAPTIDLPVVERASEEER